MREQLEQAIKLQQAGQLDEAAKIYQEVLQQDANNPTAIHYLGVCHCIQGQEQQGLKELEESVRLAPGSVTFALNVARFYFQQKNYSKASHYFHQVMQLDSMNQEAVKGYAGAQYQLGNSMECYNAMGCLEFSTGNYRQGLVHFEKALAEDPTSNLIKLNIVRMYAALGEYAKAKSVCEEILVSDPLDKEALLQHSTLVLRDGDLVQGFKEYEVRYVSSQMKNKCRPFKEPRWQGDALNGRCLLLHWEQGRGDMLQFMRYVPFIQKTGGKIIVEALSDCMELFRCVAGVDEVVLFEEAFPPFDVQLSIMSLPYIFHTDLNSIPQNFPYFNFIKNKKLPKAKKANMKKIGVVWQGAAGHIFDRHRSIVLPQFSKIFENQQVQFYSLQFGLDEQQIQFLQAKCNFIDLTQYCQNYLDSAQFVTQLDLIITVDTSTVHLAGALNIPTWLLLPYACDWRWLMYREDSPWYPRLQIIRQEVLDQWSPVIEQVQRQLDSSGSITPMA